MLNLICLILSLTTVPFNNISTDTDSNTIITIHYKKEADKEYTPFQQYDFYALEDYIIAAPSSHTIENEKLKTTIKLNLTKPSLLLFGFTEYYI